MEQNRHVAEPHANGFFNKDDIDDQGMVEPIGVEPTTSAVRLQRSPN